MQRVSAEKCWCQGIWNNIFTDQRDTVFVPTASMKECPVKQGVATPLEVPHGIGEEAFLNGTRNVRGRSDPGI